MAELFQTTKQNIAKHLKAIFAEAEREEISVVNSWLTTAAYAPCGGTQFRRWATERLQEYLVQGFALDDDRLKNPESGVYFERLLEHIRDIRSS